MTTLKLNMESKEIRAVQILLGYTPDNGKYDAAFEKFVKEWQSKQKLTADGVFGSASQGALAGMLPTVSSAKNKKSAAAKAIQVLLEIEADGIFGNQSTKALKSFQAKKALRADGVCGPATWVAFGFANTEDIVLKCEDLKQFASPHGTMIYGPDKSYTTYKSGACCIASLAIVHRALGLAPAGETSTQTIQRLGRYAWEHGYRVKGSGTKAGMLATNGTTYTSTSNAKTIENALRSGHFVVLLIKNGFKNGYGGQGHYIVAYGIQNGQVLLRDVGSSTASRQKAPLMSITTGLKGAYIMKKKES